jgi:uncharacterized protein YgiM (DUF1202 family)
VEKVDPDLVARDEQGKPYTVRYEAVNAMLLNEFLKEHRKVEALEATVAQLKVAATKQETDAKQSLANLSARLEAQADRLQKVSDLVARKPDPLVVTNQ